MKNDKIDIVIPWVNGSDVEWQKAKQKRMQEVGHNNNKNPNSECRWQDWENLKYWFRAVEKNMPWINKIFLVTCGQIPEFLNINNPKLVVVRHEDYIPQECLPTFNSKAIELNYHRINELSENFILFNDDFFPIKPIKETYYFRNDVVCDELIENPIIPTINNDGDVVFIDNMINNMNIINKHFNKREVVKNNFFKWYNIKYGKRYLARNIRLGYWYNFLGFRDGHMATPTKKSTLAKLWEVEPDILNMTIHQPFRTKGSVSRYLIRYWQLCTGEFYPRLTKGKYFSVNKTNYKQIAKAIIEKKWSMIVLNEECTGEEFETVKKTINEAFECIFPDKCSFEK